MSSKLHSPEMLGRFTSGLATTAIVVFLLLDGERIN